MASGIGVPFFKAQPPVSANNWDARVADTEVLARTDGFRELRDRVFAEARPRPEHTVLDLGSGTGLLALEIAPFVDTVWAVDISPAMCDYLRAKAESAGLDNIKVAVASAVSLPLVDESVDVVISNYCLHHLRDPDKRRAVLEAGRVLRPGGRLVIGDMMFRVGISQARDRRVLAGTVMRLLRKGPSGAWRLLKNLARYISGRWEHPASADWWIEALDEAGFEQVQVQVLNHEGGIASARRPAHAQAVARPERLAA
jgi:ubiquinone/menaquinone biosynthesis C-methylase UbiE